MPDKKIFVTAEIKEEEDLAIKAEIENQGWNMSQIVRRLLREHRDRGYRFAVTGDDENNAAI